MAYIYKIVNDINNKIYIGKTVQTISDRWKRHLIDYKKINIEKRPLYFAMNKYGVSHFSIEEIEEIEANYTDERERYWIQYYNSYNEGYNATHGGDGKSYVDYDLIFMLWQENNTCREINQITGYSQKTIRAGLRNFHINEKEIDAQGRKYTKKTVQQISVQTNEVIATYSSIKDAAKSINKPHSHISDVCLGKRQTAYGFKWSFI